MKQIESIRYLRGWNSLDHRTGSAILLMRPIMNDVFFQSVVDVPISRENLFDHSVPCNRLLICVDKASRQR